MDFGSLKSSMITMDLVAKKIKCPYCVWPVDLLKARYVAKCPHRVEMYMQYIYLESLRKGKQLRGTVVLLKCSPRLNQI